MPKHCSPGKSKFRLNSINWTEFSPQNSLRVAISFSKRLSSGKRFAKVLCWLLSMHRNLLQNNYIFFSHDAYSFSIHSKEMTLLEVCEVCERTSYFQGRNERRLCTRRHNNIQFYLLIYCFVKMIIRWHDKRPINQDGECHSHRTYDEDELLANESTFMALPLCLRGVFLGQTVRPAIRGCDREMVRQTVLWTRWCT